MRAFRKARAAAITATILISTAASAQTGDGAINCDANLNPAAETEAEREQRVHCETHIGCRLVAAVVRTSCRAAEFYRNLSKREDPEAPISSDDVADAATPDYPRSEVADRVVSTARDTGRPSPTMKTVSEAFQTSNGKSVYAETQRAANSSYSKGTAIYGDGTIARGEFFHNSHTSRIELREGQLIARDGRMQAGNFDSQTGMMGPGVTTNREPDGRTSILEGTFLANRPDGEMVRRYSDGTSVRELWRRGAMVQRGELSTPGGVPPRLGQYTAPLPAWSPPMLEGLYKDSAGPGRERVLLWCNRQLIAAGEPAPAGQAIAPQPRECANPGSYRTGMLTVVGGDFRRRHEYWCRGKMIGASTWVTHHPIPKVSPEPRCDNPVQQAEADDVEIAGKDAIERTLVPGKFKPVAGAGKSAFPCPLGGTSNIMDQLRNCMNESQVTWGSAPGNDQCRNEMMNYINAGYTGGMPGYYSNLHIPWSSIRTVMLSTLNKIDVDYINSKFVEEQMQFLRQRYGWNSTFQSFNDAYRSAQNCVSRVALCNAGNRAFCA